MADPGPTVESRQGGGHRRGGITMDEGKKGLYFPQNFPNLHEYPGRNIVQALALLHESQVPVGLDAEEIEGLPHHATVLTRGEHVRRKVGALL